MRELEIEQRSGRQRRAGAPQPDARRGQPAQVGPQAIVVRRVAAIGRMAGRSSVMAHAGSSARKWLGKPRGRMRLGGIHQALPREPCLEFRRRAAAEQIAHGERVVERGALIAEHDVVGARHAHHEVDAGRDQQRQQRVHVVLVGLGVVGVADVDAHRHAHQLAAEMILQPGAGDLLAVEQIFRPDEADHGVDQQRLERAAPPHRRAPPASAGRRRDARWPTARCPARSRNTSRCRRRCRGEATAPPRAPRRAARDRCRSSCWRPRCRRSTGTRDRPASPCGSARAWS